VSAPHTVRSGPAQIDDGSRRVTTDESAELKRLKAGKRRTHARQCDADGRLGFLRRRAGPARPPIPQGSRINLGRHPREMVDSSASATVNIELPSGC
jgi:hypothetical protein